MPERRIMRLLRLLRHLLTGPEPRIPEPHPEQLLYLLTERRLLQ